MGRRHGVRNGGHMDEMSVEHDSYLNSVYSRVFFLSAEGWYCPYCPYIAVFKILMASTLHDFVSLFLGEPESDIENYIRLSYLYKRQMSFLSTHKGVGKPPSLPLSKSTIDIMLLCHRTTSLYIVVNCADWPKKMATVGCL